MSEIQQVSETQQKVAERKLKPDSDGLNRTAQTIRAWAADRRIQRMRSDKRIGLPEKEQLAQWAAMLNSQGIEEADKVCAVMEAAYHAAERGGEWWNWVYLTLRIQLAAERLHISAIRAEEVSQFGYEQAEEDPDCDWTAAKTMIRSQIPETAFLNWFSPTRQVERSGTAITVAVPDGPTRCYLLTEYDQLTNCVLSSLGIDEVRFVVQGALPCE